MDDSEFDDMFRALFPPEEDHIQKYAGSLDAALACWASDPVEQRRIADLADLLDLEDAVLGHAMKVIQRGDLADGEALLRLLSFLTEEDIVQRLRAWAGTDELS